MCRINNHVITATSVYIMQIMELESARTEAQAEARSLAAELESLRSEGSEESSGVCHIHISFYKGSETWLLACACVIACYSASGPAQDRGSRNMCVHHSHTSCTIPTPIFAR